MYLRRAVSKTLALPRRATPGPAPQAKDASLRQMSSSKFPGTSGTNMIYYLVVGVTVGAGGYYTYKAVTSKQTKHTEHVTNLEEKTKMELQPVQGENDHEAGTVWSHAPEVSVEEAELVGAQKAPEAAAGIPEVALASPTATDAPVLETATDSANAELALTDTSAAPTGQNTQGTSESTLEVESAAPDQADARSNDKGTIEDKSFEHSAEPEENPSIGSEPSARPDAQEEAEVRTEASSAQG
ncbi:protein MGARP isoform X1 [Nannospalax galili]|uniref:Protein MGARP N-terminal domain-containing protein n=1 Tax=Nannospalax galili TaxID=1026970 RepID=A0A8C6R6F5_NANGA|nr:protein MGARP isoform X1 [Nannospalax galili]